MTSEDHPDLRASDLERERTIDELRDAAGEGRLTFELLVPEGVLIDVRAKTTFPKIRNQSGETAPAGAPRVILTGGTVFGDVRVRAQRLRERIAGRLLGRGSRG
jgi:hypothetical protein